MRMLSLVGTNALRSTLVSSNRRSDTWQGREWDPGEELVASSRCNHVYERTPLQPPEGMVLEAMIDAYDWSLSPPSTRLSLSTGVTFLAPTTLCSVGWVGGWH